MRPDEEIWIRNDATGEEMGPFLALDEDGDREDRMGVSWDERGVARVEFGD